MKVFNYWEGKKPSIIKLCQQTFEKNSDIDYIILDEKSYKNFVELQEIDYKVISKLSDITQKVDYMRLLLLYQNGGIWYDADCIIYKSLKPITNKINKHGFVGWTNMRKSKHQLANNFMGCLCESKIMNELINFTRNYVLVNSKIGKYAIITDCIWNVMENKDYYRYPQEKIGVFPVGNHAYDYAINKEINPNHILNHNPISTMLFNKIYMGLIDKLEREILNDNMLVSKLLNYALM